MKKSKSKNKIKLNDEFTAEIEKDKVIIGCHSFDSSAIKKLCKAIKKQEKDKKKIKKQKTINIEKELVPSSGELIIKDGIATARVFDGELYLLDCVFNNDDSVDIKTETFSYINLELDTISLLYNLILQAKEYYEEVL